MKSTILIATLFCCSVSCFAEEPLKALWASFYKAAKAENFSEPVKIYATDTRCQVMIFIYKKQVWTFSKGKLSQSGHVKVFNVDGINRITYESSGGDHGYFILWSNEENVLSLGY
jgi:hypothetical protein